MNTVLVGAYAHRMRHRVTLVVLAAAFACNDSTAPSPEFDAEAANATAQNVAASLGENEALRILDVLGTRMALRVPGTGLLMATTPFVPERTGDGAWLGDRATLLGATADPAVLIPGDLLGKTLVYNPATQRYEVDDERDGAPSAGVRFVLYAVDPVMHRIVSPLQEIGFLDLVDESTPSADRLAITASVHDVVLLDYEAAASIGVVGGITLTFTAVGSVGNGDDQLAFDLRQELSEASGLELDYLIGHAGDANVRLQVSAASPASVSLSLTVEDGPGRIILSVTQTENALEGAVRFNGEVVVQIAGTSTEPVFTDAAGNPLGARERRALRELIAFTGALLTLIEHLLRPAHNFLSIPVLTL